MKIIITTAVLLLTSVGSLLAQARDSVFTMDSFVVLKTSPLGLFDLDNAFTVGLEKSIGINKAIQLEAGYGNSNANLWANSSGIFGSNSSNDFRDYQVFRLRTEWRRYGFAEISHLPEGSYFAVEGFFKYVGKRDFFQVGREVINFQPTYFEFVEGNKRKIVGGSHVKFGRQAFIFNDNPAKEPRFLLDFYIGLGFRIVDFRFTYDSQRPNDIPSFQNNQLFGTIAEINETTPFVSGTLGVKLGFLLR